jgi:hypothetical protein
MYEVDKVESRTEICVVSAHFRDNNNISSTRLLLRCHCDTPPSTVHGVSNRPFLRLKAIIYCIPETFSPHNMEHVLPLITPSPVGSGESSRDAIEIARRVPSNGKNGAE